MSKWKFDSWDSQKDLEGLSEMGKFLSIVQEFLIEPILSFIKKVQVLGYEAACSTGQPETEKMLRVFEAVVQQEEAPILESLGHNPFLDGGYIGPISMIANTAVMHEFRKIPGRVSNAAKKLSDTLRSGDTNISVTWLEDELKVYYQYFNLDHWRQIFIQIPIGAVREVQNSIDAEWKEMFYSVARIFSDVQERSHDLNTEAVVEITMPKELAKEDMPYASLMGIILTEYARNAIEAGATHIQCSAKLHNDVFEFAIEDNGPGIPDHVYQAVYKEGKRGITTKKNRTGLGMASNKELIEVLGGTVFAEKNDPNGTRIRILFPKRQRSVTASEE